MSLISDGFNENKEKIIIGNCIQFNVYIDMVYDILNRFKSELECCYNFLNKEDYLVIENGLKGVLDVLDMTLSFTCKELQAKNYNYYDYMGKFNN